MRRHVLLAVINVLIADDEALVRGGFRSMLERQTDIEVIGEAGDGKQAVELSGELRPDVVLMDIRVPRLNGLEATRRLLSAATGRVPRLSDRETEVLRMVARGASNAEIASQRRLDPRMSRWSANDVLVRVGQPWRAEVRVQRRGAAGAGVVSGCGESSSNASSVMAR